MREGDGVLLQKINRLNSLLTKIRLFRYIDALGSNWNTSLSSRFNIQASMGVPPVLAAILFLALWLPALSAEMEPDEGPPLVFSHHLVPEDLRGGERYQLGPIGHVVNFGYEFELYSDFGEYRVRGIDMLEKQVNEIHALEKVGGNQ